MNQELSKFNQLVKKQGEIYHLWAKKAGLTDTKFWILYELWISKRPLIQHSFCEKWCYSKQTVNTAITSLEEDGMLSLGFAPGSRKQKEVLLTEKGMDFCTTWMMPLVKAEEEILMTLDQKEREQFLDILKHLILHLSLALEI
ncbi:MAG: MarR family winged helix-turn-helix transcriptional regulator [Tissierellia bacterium]|nr:MarR family winged helix-turn-helix transcriptional regulator [Tissierellia bacterium]